MYRELQVWQKAMDLVSKVYELCDKLPKSEDYNLKSQIKRAIISVPLNIAEGKARYSAKDFAHFLNIAKGSLIEVEVGFEIALKLKYIDNYSNLNLEIESLSKMLSSFINKLK